MKKAISGIKSFCSKVREVIESGEYTNREAVMAGVCLFLIGVFVGIAFSPKKSTMIGSNNGNNNAGTFHNLPEDEEEE